jgi:hypothetical protein
MSTDGQLTFTRSNDTATRVASNGLIEKVRTNILLHSQAFENAVYNKGTGGSVSANSVMAPDGTMTADAYTFASSTSEFAYLAQSVAGTSQIPNTFSIYIKRPAGSGSRTLRLAVTDVTISTTFSSNFTVTESWQRFEFARTSASTTGNVGIGLMTGSTGVSIAAGEVLDVWGAQLETGDIATNYIPTTTAAVSVGPVANVPRLDYLGSTCPRLLLEPSRSNLVTFSENFDNAAWTKTNTTASANTSTSPDGTASADTLTETTTNGIHFAANANASVVSGTSYTATVFLKKTTGSPDWMQVAFSTTGLGGFANFNLTTQTIGNFTAGVTARLENYGNGWFRCSITQTATATGSSTGGPVIVFTNNTNPIVRFVSYAGNTSVSILAWGAQFEAGAYATSYIPTLGAAVSRGADSGCNKTGISSLIGQAEGTLFVEVDLTLGRNNTGAGNGMLEVLDSGRANAVTILKSSTVNQILIALRVNSVNTFITAGAYISGTNKIAFAYKSGQNVCYVNGVLAATNSLSFTFSASVDAVNVGAYTTNVIDDRLSQALLFKTRLDNATLASLTTL